MAVMLGVPPLLVECVTRLVNEAHDTIQEGVLGVAGGDSDITRMRTPGFNYCECMTLLLRNLPDGSMLQYGQKEHVYMGGHPSYGGTADWHASAHIPTANTRHASTEKRTSGSSVGNPVGELVDAVEAVHLQARDIGVLAGAAVGGIVVLVAVGLVLRSLLVRDAKPVFTCLEKADKKGSPA